MSCVLVSAIYYNLFTILVFTINLARKMRHLQCQLPKGNTHMNCHQFNWKIFFKNLQLLWRERSLHLWGDMNRHQKKIKIYEFWIWKICIIVNMNVLWHFKYLWDFSKKENKFSIQENSYLRNRGKLRLWRSITRSKKLG